MDEATLASLPDAAFCAGRLFGHHTDCVKKPTENSSVDTDLLKEALAAVNGTDLPQADKQAALDHLKAHALALDFEDSEVADLIGDAVEPPDYATRIAEAASFVEAEDLLVQLVEAKADEELVALAHDRYIEFANVDREAFADEYDGSLVDAPKQGEDGLWHFTARVAQADKVNKNKRLYPKEEFEKNLARVNRLCKAGRFTGRDGHSSMFGDDKPSEICVRYDAVMLQGSDLIVDGTIVPTQAGQNLVTLWENGVQFEWSIVSYGIPDYQNDDKGNFTHAVIRELVWDGCDPVRRGAASTRTMKITKPKDSVDSNVAPEEGADEIEDEVQPEASPEETHMGEEVKDEKTVEEPVAEAPKTDTIDVDAIKAEALKDAKAAIAEAVAAAKAEAVLESAKEAAVAKLAEGDELVAKIVAKHLVECKTADEITAAITDITPIAERMKSPKPVAATGIHIHMDKDREREKYMFDGAMKVIDRPETIAGVKAALLEGMDDNGRNDASNKRWCMEQVINNYENSRETSKYLYAMTKRGFAETATTTTALGTTLPIVLPIIRQMLPQLIPYDIASVQPIDRPNGRVYFYDPIYAAGTNGSTADDSNLDDSAVFDTGWADHTEADTKSQISFKMTYSDVTATEKAVYWDYTSAVMQDMQAIYSMDVEASMMSAATDYLALELNMKFIETLAAGAGINAGTFGTGLPSAGFENVNDWMTWGLSQYLNRASSEISKKMYQSAGWIITGPTQATVFEASNSYSKLPAGDVKQFGSGLRQTGTWQNLFDVFVCDWAETLTSLKNKMLIGYKPQDWNRAAAVFCPYVPLYISPVDATASTNTIAHSAASRNAMKVLQANGLATLTISDAAGELLKYTN